ncbi:MAG TPA: outer membrane protein assembly factor BamD [bacterium]
MLISFRRPALVAGLGLLLGCALTPPQEVVWMRQDIKGLQDQVRTLRSQVASPETAAQIRNIEAQQQRNQQRLADRMVEIELQLGEVNKQMRGVQAASEEAVHGGTTSQQQVVQLQERVAALELAVQDVSRQLQQARAAQGPAADQRLAALEQRMGQLAQRPEPKPAAKPKPTPTPAPKPEVKPKSPETSGATAAPDVQQAYEAALKAIRDGDRKAGIQAMEGFVKANPHTDLTDNAYYWIGEGYYAEAQYESAILKFDDLLIRFPASDKVAGALLKTGMAFAALAEKGDRNENLADARLAFKQVIQRFPDSPEAKVAREQLDKAEGK